MRRGGGSLMRDIIWVVSVVAQEIEEFGRSFDFVIHVCL